MQNDLYAAVKNAVYSGMSIDEAIKEAQKKVLDTSEKVYLYDKMADSWNLQGIAIDYYNAKDLPDPKTPITPTTIRKRKCRNSQAAALCPELHSQWSATTSTPL